MASLVMKITYLAGTLVIASLLYNLLTRVINASKSRSRGCKPLPHFDQPIWDPLNLRLASIWNEYAKNKNLIGALRGMFASISQREGRNVTTFHYSFFRVSKVFTMDPKNIQAILATQFEDFEIGADRIGNFMPFLGPGIFNSNGQRWAHSRAMLRPCFTRDQINDLQTQEKFIRALMTRLPVDDNGWTAEVDLQPLFFEFTIDHATEFLFGESANTLTGDKSFGDGKAFAAAFDHVSAVSSDRFRLGMFYWLYQPKSYREACKKCHDFIDNYVHLALSRTEMQSEKDIEKAQAGTKYVFLHELVKHTRDPLQIRAELLNILLAGRDTTASLLSFLFALLARHPHIYARLREEVLLAFGTAEQSKQELTFSSLKACSYLQYTLSETLRLHPSVPFNGPRVATKDTTLPRGGGADGLSQVFMPKGQQVDYMIFATQRDPTIWGTDAESFRPERFRARKSGFEYLPFNAGPRVCIGQQFALTTAGVAAVRLLQRFEMLEDLDGGEVKDDVNITASSGNGVKVRLREVGR